MLLPWRDSSALQVHAVQDKWVITLDLSETLHHGALISHFIVGQSIFYLFLTPPQISQSLYGAWIHGGLDSYPQESVPRTLPCLANQACRDGVARYLQVLSILLLP
jgi:hypothetical protein